MVKKDIVVVFVILVLIRRVLVLGESAGASCVTAGRVAAVMNEYLLLHTRTPLV